MNNTDGDMHMNVLFKKMLFNERQDFESLNKFTSEQLTEIIETHISQVIKQMLGHSIPMNWRKNIDEWEQSLNKSNGEYKLINDSPEVVDEIVLRTKREHNVRQVSYTFSESVKNWNNDDSSTDFISNGNLEKIGRIGERIVFDYLIKEYGIDNVNWTASTDKYAPYDIWYYKNDTKHYVEVKSSTRMNMINWYISRREYEFYKKNRERYSLFFVKDINRFSELGALIQEIKNPNIIIDNIRFGTEQNQLLVTPIKYKGLA